MGSGPTKTTNQNQWQVQNTQSAPWAPAQAGLQQSLDLAQTAAANTYNGSSVAGLDPLVTQGQNQNIGAAGTNLPGQLSTSAGDAYSKLIAAAGLAPEQINALSGLNQAQGWLNPYASGQYLQPGQNPYLDQVLQAAQDKAASGVNAQFSAAGRYGSGAQSGELAQQLGNIQTQGRMADYNQQQQNQLNALQQLQSLAGERASIGQAGVGNVNSATSAIPTLAAGQIWAGNTLQGIGADKMNYLQQVINAANADPWTKAQNLASITGGIGQLGGTQSGTSYGQVQQQQQTNPGVFGDILAGVGGLANLAKVGNPFSFGK